MRAMLLEKNRWIIGWGRGGTPIARRARREGGASRFEIGVARFCSAQRHMVSGGAASRDRAVGGLAHGG